MSEDSPFIWVATYFIIYIFFVIIYFAGSMMQLYTDKSRTKNGEKHTGIVRGLRKYETYNYNDETNNTTTTEHYYLLIEFPDLHLLIRTYEIEDSYVANSYKVGSEVECSIDPNNMHICYIIGSNKRVASGNLGCLGVMIPIGLIIGLIGVAITFAGIGLSHLASNVQSSDAYVTLWDTFESSGLGDFVKFGAIVVFIILGIVSWVFLIWDKIQDSKYKSDRLSCIGTIRGIVKETGDDGQIHYCFMVDIPAIRAVLRSYAIDDEEVRKKYSVGTQVKCSVKKDNMSICYIDDIGLKNAELEHSVAYSLMFLFSVCYGIIFLVVVGWNIIKYAWDFIEFAVDLFTWF